MYKEGNIIRVTHKIDGSFKFGKLSDAEDVTVINEKFLDFEILEVRNFGKKKIKTEVTYDGETHNVWFLIDSLERNFNVTLNNPIQIVGC